MNTPNKLTILRIILVIPFIIIMSLAISIDGALDFFGNKKKAVYLFVAGVIFAVAMITDFIDGYLARKNNQITSFGKLFDPLADKFMTTSALIMLSVLEVVPFYITLLFILRDILVDGSRNISAKHNVSIAASWYGKWKTLLLSIGLLLVFFITPFIHHNLDLINPSWEIWVLIIPILGAELLSVVGGIDYFKQITKYINME
ncbi:CDP-diacylglycerol--glycerol-3-phosphate 3-phosphatidyltransferase [Candidatus Mycoplasma mahonii]|uniref:CDP-diacylglycerol--glycerol-3-phosphate 3-phosphatidyltransferase n=1 Tax=Candidatus Mycoplasma mahonii TaxID=3004105 RepID=UPI0026F1F96C|nr:CDP-diacylglycerol--glycerol-3-phosphate 3-phosphatidyltransferase [Candidatus Mycoplasma mahonii]WKX02794.1 CDP-diacylglycerol--glycerol-3-phosphate 3-phosphatidyltransferase [Candidatus Mycoplasma mahonii]